MKIAIYGDHDWPGSGSWCYSESLLEMGHELVQVDDDVGLESYANSVPARIVRRLLRRPLEIHRRRHAEATIAQVAETKPEAVIVLKGLHLSASDIDAMRATGAWVVIINHDDFFSRNRTNWTWVQRAAIPRYSFVFVTREQNVEEIARLNPNVAYIPFAYYPRIHRAVPISAETRNVWESDVVFVGTWERERAAVLEELALRVPARYSIWGNQWEKLRIGSPLRRYVHGRAAEMDDMCRVIGASKAALGFLRKANRDGHTQRTFEIPACGGVLLAERTPQHLAIFKEGEEAEFFDVRDISELERKTRLLLENDVHRERLRQAGQAALHRQRHTYRDRLEQVLAIYESRRR